ncbi:MAG: DUF3137 domain-containing protein [Armatimonadetes bacterium]|nr:DUF3137 domain-containing protein [Armatimonadota bacterium]
MESIAKTAISYAPIVFGAIVVLVIVAQYLNEKSKSERFFRLAQSLGLSYVPSLEGGTGGLFETLFNQYSATTSFVAKYEGFAPMGRPRDRVRHIFSGHKGEMGVEVFQYQYTTSSGKNSSTHYYSVASATFGSALPAMSVSPEGFADRFIKFFGGQDIQFESNEFNERFVVTGADEQAVHAILHPQMMQWIMDRKPPSLQTGLNRVVLHQSGKLSDGFLTDSLAIMAEFWSLVPPYVKEEGA